MLFNPQQFDYAQRARSKLEYMIKRNVIFDLTEKKKVRTNLQNRYLHLAFNQVHYETGYSVNEIKQLLFKKIVNPEIFIKQSDLGEYLRSTADLNTAEMTKAIDKFRDYCIVEIGIYIPEPHEEEKIRLWEADLSRYQ